MYPRTGWGGVLNHPSRPGVGLIDLLLNQRLPHFWGSYFWGDYVIFRIHSKKTLFSRPSGFGILANWGITKLNTNWSPMVGFSAVPGFPLRFYAIFGVKIGNITNIFACDAPFNFSHSDLQKLRFFN